GPVIGRGSSATVYLATTAAGDLFAVKSSELSASVFLQKEQRFLSRLNSPHVISYMGFDVDYDNNKPKYNLFMEYAAGGTISDVIKNNGGSLDESLIRSYTRQILLGLNHLHSNHLVHCDIKCENILVGENGVKIGDLGCAKLVENAFSGTPVFMAPEVARGEEQGFAADVWALGCVVIEMATGSNPWPEVNDPVSALYRIGFSGDLPAFPRWLSAEATDFLTKSLKRDAKERWTTEQLLRHPFVDNSNPDFTKVEEFTKSSPTSILDQDFWSSLEVPESSPAVIQTVKFSGESPVDRMNRLIEASTSMNPSLPNWEDDGNWILIRSNDTEEGFKMSEWIQSYLFSNFRVGKMGGFDLLVMENHVVEGGNQSVTN
ncbi:Protein kinase, ATP binding site-containing protein, partial [Cynara cardunculus var. scolymus]